MRIKIYDALIQKYATQYLPQVDWKWLLAQAMAESALNPDAKSPVGAAGLFQIMHDTGEEIAGELGLSSWSLFDPETSIHFGCFYMEQCWSTWTSKRSDIDHLRLAQSSYNAGSGNILKAQRLAGGALDYATIISFLPKVTGLDNAYQTTHYVATIGKYYAQLVAEAAQQGS